MVGWDIAARCSGKRQRNGKDGFSATTGSATGLHRCSLDLSSCSPRLKEISCPSDERKIPLEQRGTAIPTETPEYSGPSRPTPPPPSLHNTTATTIQLGATESRQAGRRKSSLGGGKVPWSLFPSRTPPTARRRRGATVHR